jgi:hypothetical protein
MYEAAASCKDVSRASLTNWEPHGVRRETRDVSHLFYITVLRYKSRVSGRSPAEITGSNPAEDMGVCL